VATDARAAKYDGGIITRLNCVVFGVVVNKHAVRFYDEGEDIWPKRDAIWGRLVAQQLDQIAYTLDLFMPSLFPPITADSIRELAQKLVLNADVLDRTIGDFNAGVRPGTFNLADLDDCRTEGVIAPKTHWRPHHSMRIRCGRAIPLPISAFA
jgi:tricarballylate dehydrogenase